MKNLYYLVAPQRHADPELAEEFRTKPLREWIAQLPTANLGLTIRLFHDRIIDMNSIELEPEILLQALEDLYPTYVASQEFLLQRLIGKGVPLSSDQQKIARLAESISKEYLTGYGRILREVSSASAARQFARSLPRVLCRLLRGLSRILLLHFLLRIPEPEWLWLDLHGLYLLAEQKAKHEVRIQENNDGKSVTIATVYKQIVLLKLADPLGLGHREILDVYESLEQWSESLEISAKAADQNSQGAVLYVDEDEPPLLSASHDPNRDLDLRVYQIPLESLLKKISELLTRTDASIGRFDLVGIGDSHTRPKSSDLLEYLRDRWSGIRPTKHDLFEDRKPRMLSIGLKATHQQLSPPGNPEEKLMSDWVVTVNEDQSLRGEFDQTGQVYVGSLLSLKLIEPESARRMLGVINRVWMNRLDGAVHFNITLLAPNVLAAGIQPTQEKRELLVYQRALLFFTESPAGRTPNLVVESRKLANGQILQLLTGDETVRVQLENRKNVALGYWQFECIPLADEQKEDIPIRGYDFL